MRLSIVALASIIALSGASPRRAKFGSTVKIYNGSDTSIRYGIYRVSPKYYAQACLNPGASFSDSFPLGDPDWVSVDFYELKHMNCSGGIVYYRKENYTGPRTDVTAKGSASGTRDKPKYEYSVTVSH